jgi:O-antigen/teichoic acid export membrane protein
MRSYGEMMAVPPPAPAEGEPLLSGHVAGRIARGLVWNLGGSFGLQVIRTIIAIALARLLTPDAYGVARMVLVLGPLVMVLSDLGLGMGLIQRNTITDVDRSTVFWASVGLGVVWTGLGIGAARLAADFYGRPDIAPMFQVYASTFILGSLGATHAVLLQRTANFRGLQLRLLGATLISGVAALTAAVAGWGAWAIILQQVVLTAADTVLLWYFSSWRPSFAFSTDSLRSFGIFGLRVFGTRLMFFFNRNTDNALVGRYLGSGALGIYSLAYNVMLTPFARLLLPVQATLMPYVMRMQEAPAQLAKLWLRTSRLAAAFLVPCVVGLIIVAPDLVRVVMGARWERAAPILQILAIAALLQSLTMSVPDILAATGRVGRLFQFSVLSTLLQVGGFAIGLHWGLVGVAWSYAITNGFLAPLLIGLGLRALGIDWRMFVRQLVPVATATACMAAPALALRLWLESMHIDGLVRLAFVVALGAAVYSSVSLWNQQELVSDVRRFGSRRVPEGT